MKKIAFKILSLSLFLFALTFNASAQIKSDKKAPQLKPITEKTKISTKTPSSTSTTKDNVPVRPPVKTTKPGAGDTPAMFDAKIEKKVAKLAGKLGLIKGQLADFTNVEKPFLYEVKNIKTTYSDKRAAKNAIRELYTAHLGDLGSVLNDRQLTSYKKYTRRFLKKKKKRKRTGKTVKVKKTKIER